jgi:5-methylcytosine-specific restriction protein A
MARNGSTRAWRKLRAQILIRDNHLCQIKGPRCTVIATTVDHVMARIHGGQDAPSNLVAACETCNKQKGDR